MNDQLDRRDQLTQALLDDGADLEDIVQKLAIAKSQLNHIKHCSNTWDYLEHSQPILYDLSDALDSIKNVEWFLQVGVDHTPDTQVEPKPLMHICRVTWKTKLENFFINTTYASLLTTAIMASSCLGFWGLSQARPDIPQFEVATNYSKGLGIFSFSLVLLSAIGGGVTAGLIDMEEKEE
ncbi:hypothetical protein NIES4106_61090 (plasmid) [Fischerella sp. NIES-4106]|nr:hypothetical protein NIES4106_61090 [Fischerella sp. NIES-4106]